MHIASVIDNPFFTPAIAAQTVKHFLRDHHFWMTSSGFRGIRFANGPDLDVGLQIVFSDLDSQLKAYFEVPDRYLFQDEKLGAMHFFTEMVVDGRAYSGLAPTRDQDIDLNA